MDPTELLPLDAMFTMTSLTDSETAVLEPSLNICYTFPLATEFSLTDLGAGLSDVDLADSLPIVGGYFDSSTTGRHVSLYCQRPDVDMDLLPTLPKTRSLTFDVKQSAREVSTATKIQS